MTASCGTIISLGGSCEVAHHIRRTQSDHAHIFDWWITPFDAAIALIENDFSGLFEADNMAVLPARQAVYCRRYGIIHHHDFERDAAAGVVVETIERQLPALREKYAALASRFRPVPGERTLLIRGWLDLLHAPRSHGRVAPDDVPSFDFPRLLAALERRFGPNGFEVLFLNYGRHRCDDRRAIFRHIEDCGDIQDWTGSAAGWDRVLGEMTARPPATLPHSSGTIGRRLRSFVRSMVGGSKTDR